MSKKLIRGTFAYKDDEHKEGKKLSKKQQRKEAQKKLELKNKELKKMCLCNHRDRKHNRVHFKMNEDGSTYTCKICGGTLIKDEAFLTKESVESATQVIYTIYSLVRAKLPLNENDDEKIVNALFVLMRTPEFVEMVQKADMPKDGKGKKDKKHKKHNKDDFRKYSRIKY